MKKNIFAAFVVAVVATFASYNVYQSQKMEIEMSDLMLANVEALAMDESSKTCEETCYKCNGWQCTRIYYGVTSVCYPYRKK